MNTSKLPLERAVVKKIKTALESRGSFVIKLHGSVFMVGGLPDLVGCYRGRFFGFEVKRGPGIPPKPIQEYWLKRIAAAGGMAATIHSAEMALDRLREIEAQVPPP